MFLKCVKQKNNEPNVAFEREKTVLDKCLPVKTNKWN